MSVFSKSVHFSLLEISVADNGKALPLIIKAENGSVWPMPDRCCSGEVIKGRERVPPTPTPPQTLYLQTLAIPSFLFALTTLTGS